MKNILFGLLIIAVVLSGCLQNQTSQQDLQSKPEDSLSKPEDSSLKVEGSLSKDEIAAQECKTLCEDALKLKWDLSNGPCLSSATLSWDVADWVCDVAHSPREAVDDLAENQCEEFGVSASHFVELDSECNFIKAI